MSLLPKLKPKPQPHELDAYFAPGHFFFCRRVAIPAEIKEGEEGDYLLLELEGMSPFPLEHLYSGFVIDDFRRYAFVFAAYKRRFEASEVAGWRRSDTVLPDFMVALQRPSSDGQSVALATERSFALFAYDAESSLPCRFYAEERPHPAEGESLNLERELNGFCQRAPEGLRGKSARRWIANGQARWLGQEAWFGAEQLDEAPAAKIAFPRSAVWKADLRDPEMVAKAQRDERRNQFLWKGLLSVAAAIALAMFGELIWAGTLGGLAFLRSQNENRAPLTQEIDSIQALTSTLVDFQDSNVEPFLMIESLAPYQKWPAVVYRRFETNGPDTLVLEARAENSMQMTEFKRRLESFGKVNSVDITRQDTNASGTTFTAMIQFLPFAFASLEEVATNE